MSFGFFCNREPSKDIIELDEIFNGIGGQNYYITYGPGLASNCKDLLGSVDHFETNSTSNVTSNNATSSGRMHSNIM